MPLFLIESNPADVSRAEIQQRLDAVAHGAAAQGAELVEVQVAGDLRRLFAVIDAAEESRARQIFEQNHLTPTLIKAVRLIGQDLATVKARKEKSNYLVEWNFPANLTMDVYLKRKAEKTPLYAKVPEVSFERTYVCEDMTKCLCFYDSPDEEKVRHAREVVGAPVHALTPIQNIR